MSAGWLHACPHEIGTCGPKIYSTRTATLGAREREATCDIVVSRCKRPAACAVVAHGSWIMRPAPHVRLTAQRSVACVRDSALLPWQAAHRLVVLPALAARLVPHPSEGHAASSKPTLILWLPNLIRLRGAVRPCSQRRFFAELRRLRTLLHPLRSSPLTSGPFAATRVSLERRTRKSNDRATMRRRKVASDRRTE